MSNNKIRIGILGTGNIVKKIHLPLLCRMPDIAYMGLADIEPARAKELIVQNDFPLRMMSVDEMLNSKKLNVILITTPNFLHPIQVKRALLGGKHVICEKPLSTTLKECRSILHLSKRVSRSVFIGYANQFRPDVQYMKKILEAELLGKLKSIQLGWIRKNGIPGLNSWFTQSKYSRGGALVDIGGHLIDILNDILPQINTAQDWEVSGRSIPITDKDISANADWYNIGRNITTRIIDVEKAVKATLRNDELSIDLEVSWNKSKAKLDKTYFHLDGKNGRMELNTLFGFSPNGRRLTCPLRIYLKKEGSILTPEFEQACSPMLPYQNQWNYFIKKIRQDSLETNMLNREIRNAAMIQAIYQSARTNSVVSLSFNKTINALN